MSALLSFFGVFWWGFIVTGVVLSLVWLGKMVSLDGNASFASSRQFKELAVFQKDQQKQLLHAADRQAFSGWRCILPVFVYSIVFSGSLAGGLTIRNTEAIPYAAWTGAAASLLTLCLGVLVLRRLEVYRLRPFLASQIEQYRQQSEPDTPTNAVAVP